MNGQIAEATTSQQTARGMRIVGLSKTFSGIRALNDVTFDIQRGSITALLGMNGSGKSTLIKILAGVYQPDDGAEIEIGGEQTSLPFTPASAHRHGLRFLHQDVGLVDSLTVADNFAFVDRFRGPGLLGPIRRRSQNEHVRHTLHRFGVDVEPETLVRDLTPTQRTMVGVSRALQDDALHEAVDEGKVLILDEPTAALPPEEVNVVLTALEELRSRGGTVIYVSHRTDEVARLADRIVVLRDGHLMVDEESNGLTSDEIVTKVIGKRLERLQTTHVEADSVGPAKVAISSVTGHRIRNVSLDVREGEILGIAGLVGCGRSELMRMIGGAQPLESGSMQLGSEPYAPKNPADALDRGVASVPQDRRGEGIVMQMQVGENLTLGRLSNVSRRGALSKKLEASTVDSLIASFGVKTAGPTQIIGLLSGGNQQKVVLGRAASFGSSLLLLDEPTQGVDANAKAEIAGIIRQQAASGAAVILASTDFEDFVGLAHRVIVLDRGRIVGTASGSDIDVETLARICAQNAENG